MIACIAQHLTPVKLEKINRFGSVTIRLRPGLRNLMNHPGRQLMFSLPQNRSHAEQEINPLLRAGVFPGLKGLIGRLHGLVCQFFRRLLKTTDYLGAISWINTVELCVSRYALAANHQRVLTAQLAFYFLKRGAHSLRIFWFAEIS